MQFFRVALLLISHSLFAKADWCTRSPEKIYAGFIEVDFSGSCRNHDICYFSLGRQKYSCDRDFLNDLRSACNSRFTSWAHRWHLGECRGMAEIYHEGLISGFHDLDRQSFNSAQRDAQTAYQAVQACKINSSAKVAESLATLQAEGVGVTDSIRLTVQKFCLQTDTADE